MSLFRVNNAPIMFDIVDVKFQELNELRTLIEQNGGIIGSSIKNRVKFTSAEMFLFREANCKCCSENCPMHFAVLYDVKFIKDCVLLQCLFDASLYRLNPTDGKDEHIIQRFLFGYCTELDNSTPSNTNSGANSPKIKVLNPRSVEMEGDIIDISDEDSAEEKQRSKKTSWHTIQETPASAASAVCNTTVRRASDWNNHQGENSNVTVDVENPTTRLRVFGNRTLLKEPQTRKPFSSVERRNMIRYVVNNGVIRKSKGFTVWQKMIDTGLTGRSMASLQNHYVKHILPNIQKFNLPGHVLEDFLRLRDTKRKPRKESQQEGNNGYVS